MRPDRRLACLLLPALFLPLAGCDIFVEKPTPSLVEPHAAVPRVFLFSWHKPYNDWMDTPVRVFYNKVPLDQIFNHSPFDRLSYQFIEKPAEMPLVSIDSLGITRRQLLWAIAHDNNLQMSLKTLPNGHPSEVIIRDRGDADSYRGRIDQSEIKAY
jgi:hypothetical protein